MTSRRSFVRKIIYLIAIALLLVPLFWLSQPATSGTGQSPGSRGGKLAQLRQEHNLSEMQLGEIDPTSETLRLATFGLRGVAAIVLWQKAHEYKKKKDWTNLSATLEQLAKVEPHFASVWQFQAWNISYNVSAEFDDFRERYRWVIKGINYLDRGIRYNERNPKLVWALGWMIAQKIGRADESRQFRILFRLDDDFHEGTERSPQDRDNWLVGRESFMHAEDLVDQGVSLGAMSPVVFFANAPMSLMNYSEGIEKDGIFGERAGQAWENAFREWTEGPSERQPFGERDLHTSFGKIVQLNNREEILKNIERLAAKLDSIAPANTREKLLEERRAKLSQKELEAEATPWGERTAPQHQLVAEIEKKCTVTHEDVANKLSGGAKAKALKEVEKLNENIELADIISRQRTIVNFEFWRMRAEVEQSPEILAARKLVFEGTLAFALQHLPQAREYFDQAFPLLRNVLGEKGKPDTGPFPGLASDSNMGQEIMEMLLVYRKVLQARDEEFPDDFILQDIIDMHKDSVDNWEPPAPLEEEEL